MGIVTKGILLPNTLQLLLSVKAGQRLAISLLSQGSFFPQTPESTYLSKIYYFQRVSGVKPHISIGFCVSPLEFFPREIHLYSDTSFSIRVSHNQL